MMNRTAKLVLTSSALFLAFFVGRPDTAQAVSATSNVTVTANVVKACTISDATLAFGAYDPLNATALDKTGTLSYTCTASVPITVDLANGGYSGGGLRGMSDGDPTPLTYQIFSDTGRTIVWGTALGGSSVSGAGTGSAASFTMYGRVPAGQAGVTPGNYSDTVVATLTF